MDRRIEKSKTAIIDALTQLISEKDFDKITINDIADRANVNRGTIYLHYVDEYDLLDHCIETHVNQLFECCLRKGDTDNPSAKAAIFRIFEYLKQHAFLYSNMLTNKWSTAFRNHLHTVIEKMIKEQIDKKGIDPNMNEDILIQYVASATVGVMEWWITNSMPYSSTEMVEQLGFLLERVQLVHKHKD